jgi:ADP-heptose:LPS heptosyltransferase
LQINIDCKYYLGNKPCKFHKIDERPCENCRDYARINKRILIIKLDALGDVLRTTCILPSLSRKYPGSHITWLTKSDATGLLKNNKYIDRILTFENKYLDVILNEEFDIGICLDAENKSAVILSLASCTEKSGFLVNKKGQLIPSGTEAEKWYLMGLNDIMKRQNRETYQSIIYGICKLDGEIFKPQYILDENTEEILREFKIKSGLDKFNMIVGLNTGGGSRWECKSWIKEYYIELINKLRNTNKNIGIILYGGEKEKGLINYIKKEVHSSVIDAECYDSVEKFAGMINLSDIFVTPDSLGFHFGVALNKYSIVFVGPTSPWELDVYGNGEIVYNNELDCIACYDAVCSRNKECMKSITPDIILEKIMKRIDEISNS